MFAEEVLICLRVLKFEVPLILGIEIECNAFEYVMEHLFVVFADLCITYSS